MRRARAAAVRPCVDAARDDRRDVASSAVIPEPERAHHRSAACAVTTEAATDEHGRTETVVAERRSDVVRAGRGVRRARATAVRPCVDAARDDRRDVATSAVIPEPGRALHRSAARAVTTEAATDEHGRTETVAAERRSDVGRAGRGVRRARATAVRPCFDATRGDRQDGAASAVVPEPKRDLRHCDTRAVTAEAGPPTRTDGP